MPESAYRVRSLASYTTWYVRTLIFEVRSLPHRIRLLSQKTNEGTLPLDLGAAFETAPNGETVPCKATLAHTQYIEFLLARYPWASHADVLMALDGWDKGSQQFVRTDTNNMDAVRAQFNQYPLALQQR